MQIHWIFNLVWVHLQPLRFHNAYQYFKLLLHLLPFGHNLMGKFWDPQLRWVKWRRWSGFAPIESPPTTSKYLSIKVLHYLLPFFPIKLCPQPPDSSPVGGKGGPSESKMASIEMSTPHSYSTSIHTIGLSCSVWSQYTTWQTTEQTQWLEQASLWPKFFITGKLIEYVSWMFREEWYNIILCPLCWWSNTKETGFLSYVARSTPLLDTVLNPSLWKQLLVLNVSVICSDWTWTSGRRRIY